MTATPNECACDHCRACCESRPGWFAPERRRRLRLPMA